MPLLRSPTGAVVEVPDEQIGNFVGYTPLEGPEASAATTGLAPDDRGVLGGINAAATGLLSGATLGGSDYLLKGVLNQGQFERLAAEREGHPITSGVGQVAGAVLPALAAPESLLGRSPSGIISHATADAVTAGRAIGGAEGVARQLFASGVEGAAQNAGMYLSDTALGDRELSAEGLAASLGPGFAFGVAGSAAALGIEQGTIAARRMFSRAAGTDKAADAARAAWDTHYQATVEANDAAADIARAKLADARAAREQAQLASQRAGAEIADAKIRPGLDWTGAQPVPSEMPRAAPGPAVAAQEPELPLQLQIAGKLNDRAHVGLSNGVVDPRAAQLDAEIAELAAKGRGGAEIPGDAGTMTTAPGMSQRMRSQLFSAGFTKEEISAMGLEEARAKLGLPPAPTAMPEAKATELAQAVAEHDAARADLEEVLRGLDGSGVELGTAPDHFKGVVPIEEFGTAGQRGRDPFKRPMTAEGTPVGKVAKTPGAPADVNQEIESALAPRAEGAAPAPMQPVKQRRDFVWDAEEDNIPDLSPELPSNGQFKQLNSDEYDAARVAFRKQLTKDEAKASTAYAGTTNFRQINKALRNGAAGQSESAWIKGIDDLLESKGKLPEPMRLYRGIGLEGGADEARKVWDGIHPGDSFVDNAFGSTTASFKYADDIGKVTLAIDVPAGYPAAPLPSMVGGDEAEYVLRRGTKYRVLGMYDQGDGKILAHVEVVPSEKPSIRSLARGESVPDATSPIAVTKATAPEATSSLTGQLRSMQSQLGEGAGLSELGAPARAEYAAEKATKTKEAAEHFRAQANEKNYAGSGMAADEAAARVAKPAAPQTFEERFDEAFHRIDKAKGGNNYVTLRDLRTAMPDVGREEFDKALYEMRKRKLFSLDSANEQHVKLSPEERAAGIAEGPANSVGIKPNLVLVQRGAKYEPIFKHGAASELGASKSAEPVAETFKAGGKDLKLTTETVAMPGGKSKTVVTVTRTLGDGEEVTAASAEFMHRDRGMYPNHVNVEPALRRNGVATKMYEAAEKSTGKQILKSETQTAEGKAFRAGRDEKLAARPAKTGTEFDDFFANLTRPKTRNAYIDANLPRAWKEEGSYAAAHARLEREWAEMPRPAGAPANHDLTRVLGQDEALKGLKFDPETKTYLGVESPAAMRSAVHDVADAAKVVTKYEKASARLTEALGPEAPPAAQEAAKAFREAEDHAERKTMERTTRAIDDHAKAQPKSDVVVTRAPGAPPRSGPPMPSSPIAAEPELPENWLEQAKAQGGKVRFSAEERLAKDKQFRQWEMNAAKSGKARADAALAKARVGETEAKIGARQATDVANKARALQPPVGAATASGGSTLGAIATTIGVAGELGVPGIPHPSDIPVIGPLLGTFLKYKAIKAAAGRFVGRVPATGDARAAALVAKAKDKIVTAVDRTLGLVAETAPKARGALVATATTLGHRLIDDGEPDAPKDANAQQLAATRIREIANAAARPELVTDHVRREMKGVVDPDLILAAEQHLVARFEALNGMMPKAPPPNPYSKREWLPSPAAAYDVAQRLSVVHDPEQAFVKPTPAKCETLAACYPRLLEFAQQRLVERIGDTQHPVSYNDRLRGSLVFKVPLDDSHQPDHAAILATAHAPSPVTDAAPAQPGAAPSIAGNSNLTALYQTASDRRAMR